MKKILASLLLVPVMASAEFFAGNELLRHMKSDAMDQMHALGYVLGVVDVHTRRTICPPEGVKAGQVYDVVKKFLEENPAVRHFSADSLIQYRLEQVWPCSAPQRGRGV
jgi:Ser/Thr protein kinase RdoA (MazF antagonist)